MAYSPSFYSNKKNSILFLEKKNHLLKSLFIKNKQKYDNVQINMKM